MYELTIWLTGAIALGAAWMGYRSSRDTFHPLVFLGPMLAYSYGLTPLLLLYSGGPWRWLPREAMPYVQLYYLLGVLMITAGVLSAGRPPRKRAKPWDPAPALRRQLRSSGLLLGGIGVAAFYYMVDNVGGLEAAYGTAHGEGWADSGYVREAFFLIIPALMLLLMAHGGRRLRLPDAILFAIIGAPMLFHAVVGANRGPTFMIVMVLFVGWYLVQNRRPSMRTLLGVFGATAFLLLFLVVNRNMIYLGAKEFDFKSPGAIVEFVDRNTTGNEYILGAGMVINSYITGDYQWGARYVIGTVIRGIPSSIWPSKYEDVGGFLGVSVAGIDEDFADFTATLGWKSTGGASIGFLPEVFQQFSVFGLALVFAIGRFYGITWRRAVGQGGFWLLTYGVAVALSVFLTQQTFLAMLYRLMFFCAGGLIVWLLFIRSASPRPRVQAGMAHPRTRESERVRGDSGISPGIQRG